MSQLSPDRGQFYGQFSVFIFTQAKFFCMLQVGVDAQVPGI